MMDRDQVAALEQQQLLRGSTEGTNSGSSPVPPSTVNTLSPSTPLVVTAYSTSLTPSSLDTRGVDQRKYSSGFDTRTGQYKYSSQLDPYRKYSSVSGYGGRGYLGHSSGSGVGGTNNQQVPMIDDK